MYEKHGACVYVHVHCMCASAEDNISLRAIINSKKIVNSKKKNAIYNHIIYKLDILKRDVYKQSGLLTHPQVCLHFSLIDSN